MTVEQRRIIDIIGTDKVDGHVTLTIADHLTFDDDGSRILTLQDKINDYLIFIESGEIYGSYPNAIGRQIEISIAFKYPPDKRGIDFLAAAGKIVQDAGYLLTYAAREETPEEEV